MSLTGLLDKRRGPVWEWFSEHFPDTRSMCGTLNRQLRGGPATEPCLVPSVPGSDPGLVGMAVGNILAAHLREDALDYTVATQAALNLDGVLRRRRWSAANTERAVVTRVREMRPWQQMLGADEWVELCGLACILACCEQCFRAPLVGPSRLVRALLEGGQDLAAVARALASPSTLEDLDALGRATLDDRLGIADARELYIGPTFTQTSALGGADADIVFDGCLLDLKSSSQGTVIDRHDAWQLLGYLLADTDDDYDIRKVGFAALRRRKLFVVPAQSLITSLAGGPSPPLEHWRAEFARMLEPVAAERAARREQWLAERRERFAANGVVVAPPPPRPYLKPVWAHRQRTG